MRPCCRSASNEDVWLDATTFQRMEIARWVSTWRQGVVRWLTRIRRSVIGRLKRDRGRRPDRTNHMKPPRVVMKITVPVSDLQHLSSDQRHTLLLLGLMLNEVNWLRKLLIKSTQEKLTDHERMASLSLTMFLLTTLAGKIFEGSEKLRQGKVAKVVNSMDLPPIVQDSQKQFYRQLDSKVLHQIRKNVFHYPDALDLPKFSPPDDTESILYGSPVGDGDFLSHLSTLAIVEPILALSSSTDWRVALETVLNEVITAAGNYSNLIVGLITTLLGKLLPGPLHVVDVPNPVSENLLVHPLYFFTPPPDDMPTADGR